MGVESLLMDVPQIDTAQLPALMNAVQRYVAQYPYHIYAGAAGFASLLLAAGLGQKRHRGPLADGHGSARFSTVQELKHSGLWRRDGVVVGYAGGRHLRMPPQKHVLMVGPSGSGKSVMMQKTLETYPHSVIGIDMKGTFTEACTKIRQDMGQDVYIFDPLHGGVCIDPLKLIGWGGGTEVADIQRVVDHLTYTEATRSDAGLYYLSESQEVLWAVIPYLHYSQPAHSALGDVRKFLAVSGDEIRTRIRAMLAFGQPSPHPVIHDWAQQVVDKPMSTLDPIWSAARRWVKAWVDPTLAWNTRDLSLDLDAFQQQDKPATLLLRISVEDLQGRLQSFTRMLVDLLSLRLCDRPEHVYEKGVLKKTYRHEVLWLMDEMTELRHLPMLDRLVTYLRGYGHHLLGGIQSFAQIWQWFGRYSGILNNTAAWVLFRPNHYDEAKVIADNLGQMTVMEPVDRVTRATRGGSRSVGMQSHGRPLMTTDELRYDLQEDQVLICAGGQRPMLVSRGPLGRVA